MAAMKPHISGPGLARVLAPGLAFVLASGLAGGLAAGCRKSQDDKVTAGSTDSAVEPLVDEDYRFRIAWPGDGWKLMREHDVRQLVPDAMAGAFSQQQAWGAVIVERFPGAELDAMARLVIDSMPLEERVIEREERITFQGEQARRVTLTGRINDIHARYIVILLLHQDHVYQLIGWGPQDALSPDGAQLQPFFDAFSLLEGEVTGRDEATGVTDARGPGWRLQQGVFLSAVSRLRIAPPPGWRVAIGSELQRMNADAEVGLVARNPERYLIVIAEPMSSLDEQSILRMTRDNLSASFGSSSEEAPVRLSVAGEERALSRLRGESPPMEFLYTVLHRAGIAYQVMAWYPTALGESAIGRVAEGLAAIELLDDEAAAAAQQELAAEPDHQNAVGADHALRRGLYRDFQGKWTWRKPAGFWRIQAGQAGQAARAVNADASLYAHEPAQGLHLMAIAEDASGTDLASYVAAARGAMALNLGTAPSEPVPLRLGAVDALAFDIRAATEPLPLHYRVVGAVHDGTALQILLWGDAAHTKQHQATMAAAIDGFRFEPGLAPVTRDGSVYRDWQMGFAFELGPDAWETKDDTPAAIAGIARMITWRRGSDSMMVWSLYNPETERDSGWFFDFLEQRLREAFGKLTIGEPTRKDITVAGAPGRSLVWTSLSGRIHAYLVRRDQMTYALVGTGLSSEDAAALPGRFQFLD